jgi:solute carrier family 25 phosphate transporter 23/24/25/41
MHALNMRNSIVAANSEVTVCTSSAQFKTGTAQVKSAEKNMIAGGIAGCIGKTITAPLSRLTVLYQVSPMLDHTVSHSHSSKRGMVHDSIWVTLRNIIKKEGILSLWNGNFTSVIHRFPYSAINFASYEFAKSHLGSGDENHDSSTTRLICGAISGAASCTLCYPLDVVRTRLTVGSTELPGAKRHSSKIVGVLKSILDREGFWGLYRGLTISLSVAMPTLAISFTVYGKLKELMIDKDFDGIFVNSATGHLSPFGSLLSGSISGMSSSLVMFPLDVIRKRMQIMGAITPLVNPASSAKGEDITGSTKPPRQGMVYHGRMIFAQNGLRGFYRGIAPEIMKVCPMVAITFCSYELVKDALVEYFPSSN